MIERIKLIQGLTWEDWREDGCVPEQYAPDDQDMCWLVGSTGFIIARAVNRTTIIFHGAALPGTKGYCAKGKEVIAELRERGFIKFITLIPDYCRAAQFASYRLGFRRCGKISNCIMRDGVAHDLIMSEV